MDEYFAPRARQFESICTYLAEGTAREVSATDAQGIRVCDCEVLQFVDDLLVPHRFTTYNMGES